MSIIINKNNIIINNNIKYDFDKDLIDDLKAHIKSMIDEIIDYKKRSSNIKIIYSLVMEDNLIGLFNRENSVTLNKPIWISKTFTDEEIKNGIMKAYYIILGCALSDMNITVSFS